jgi:mannan endo-1,4-beta-mannosidase
MNMRFGILILLLIIQSVKAQPPGMYVDGRYLFSATGDTVILKGFNAMIVYWDIHGDVNFPGIEKTGANCVRIFWSLNPPTPRPEDLDLVLGNCITHHMIPIICLWDATGDWSKIQHCVDYWCSSQISPILQKYEKHLIVNIANEPGDDDMGDDVFRAKYSDAVQQMRDAGIHVPLIIDADRWGRNADAVLDNGEYLMEQDPDHNLIFSWHLWDPETWMTGTKPEIDRIIAKAAGKNICFIVGEFGPCEQCDNCAGSKINWEYLMEKAYAHDIGYLPWVWKWSDCHAIVSNATGSFGDWVNSPWGQAVAVSRPYSIQNTARRPAKLQTGMPDHPLHLSRLSAFPNPFSDAIRFRVDIPVPARIILEISDLSGNGVKQWTRTQDQPGECLFEWNVGQTCFHSGRTLLLYRLTIAGSADKHTETGKLIKW